MKLGAVVVNQTYVIDDDVVDFPIFFDKVHSLADEQIFGASTGSGLAGLLSGMASETRLMMIRRG